MSNYLTSTKFCYLFTMIGKCNVNNIGPCRSLSSWKNYRIYMLYPINITYKFQVLYLMYKRFYLYIAIFNILQSFTLHVIKEYYRISLDFLIVVIFNSEFQSFNII